MDLGSSVGVMTRLPSTRLRNHGSTPDRSKKFVSSPKTNQSSIQSISASGQGGGVGGTGYFFGSRRSRHEPDHSHHLVPSLRIIAAASGLPHMPSCLVKRQLYSHEQYIDFCSGVDSVT
jgi:hypothetical protein